MSLPDLGFGSKTNHDQLGGTTYPRYMVLYAERKETSDSTPADEDPIFGFRGAVTHTTGTDAKVYVGILNGVLPTPEHNITVSNMSAGVVIETDRVISHPGVVLNPTTTAIAPDTLGSLIYNSATSKLNYYDGAWQVVDIAGGLSAHDLTGAYHTEDATGGAGNFLKADSTTTFSWQAHGLIASDVGAYTTAQTDSAIDTDISTHAGLPTVHQDAPGLIATHAAITGAHHAQAHTLSGADHTGDLAYTQMDAIVDIVGTGTASMISAATHVHTDADGSSKVTYSNLSGIPSTFTPIAHDLTSAYHTDSGLTAGHFLKATGTTTFAWGAHGLTASDVGAAAALSGTQWTLPVFDTTTTIGDSMISQDSGGAIATVNGGLVVDDYIDLNPSGTGSQNIIDITPTAALIGGPVWRGVYIDGNALDPTGAASIYGLEATFSGVNLTNSPAIHGINIQMPSIHSSSIIIAGYFSGDGRWVKICTDTYAVQTDGDFDITGNIAVSGTVDTVDIATFKSTYDTHAGNDNAHHNEAHTLATTGPHTDTLPLTDLAVGFQGSIIYRDGTDWAELALGTSTYVLKSGATDVAWGQIDYSELAGTQPAPVAHNLIDTTGHPVSGLATGHFIKADSATTYSFQAHGLVASDVGAYTTTEVDTEIDTDINTHTGLPNAHHPQSHVLSGSDHTATGLTAGWAISADTATTFSWKAPSVGSGSQWTLPVWATTSSFGDSMISQDSGGTLATVGGDLKVSGIQIYGSGTTLALAANTTTSGPYLMLAVNVNAYQFLYDNVVKAVISSAGNLQLDGSLTVDTIAAGVADYDTFLVSDSGLVKFRTGAEVLSDIGAAASSHDFDTHSGDVDLADLAAGTQGSIIYRDVTDWAELTLGTNTYVLKSGATDVAWGQVDYSELVGTQPAPVAHNLIDTTGHPVSGLTGGHFLKATGVTTYAFGAHGLVASDVGAYTTAEVDSAIDTDIATHATDVDAHHALVTVTALPLTLSGQAITFNYNTAYFRLVGNNLEVGTETPADTEILTWSATLGAVWSAAGTGGPGSGTPWDIPVWDATGSSLTDSMISQDAGGTLATVGGALTVSGAFKAGADGFDVDASGNITDCGSIAMGGALTGVTTIANSSTIIAQGAIYNDADNSGVYSGEANAIRMYHTGTVGYVDSTVGALYLTGTTSTILGSNSQTLSTFLETPTGQSIYLRVNSAAKFTLDVDGIVLGAGVTLYTHNLSPLTNDTDTVGTSTTDKYAEMFATSFNTGDINFGNKFKITEVVRPDWNGDRKALYEDWFAHSKEDGATPGLEFWNNRGEKIALLDEDGDFHVRGKIHECSDIFK